VLLQRSRSLERALQANLLIGLAESEKVTHLAGIEAFDVP
jgi:hypothetical protein